MSVGSKHNFLLKMMRYNIWSAYEIAYFTGFISGILSAVITACCCTFQYFSHKLLFLLLFVIYMFEGINIDKKLFST